MKVIDLYKNDKTKFFLYVFVIVVSIVIAGVVLFPSVFYDNWIWKYYWGPVVADSLNSSHGTAVYNGVSAIEGYTFVSEFTYGFLIILALYVIYKFLLKRLGIVVDWKFALALMPYIIFGPVTRALEDAGYFKPPFVYWFISPLLYVQVAFYAILFLLLGYYVCKKYDYRFLSVNRVLFLGGLLLLLYPLFLVFQWIFGDGWGDSSGVRFDVFVIVFVLVSIIVGFVYLFGYIFRNRKEYIVYKNPLNLAMLAGHLIDGITSYLSIKDPLNLGLYYAEKHPASNILLEIWGPLFPITKFLLIIIVIYVFDVLYKKELKNHMTLVNLLKIGILILGFSPGLRDLLRVTMGVKE